MENWKTDLETGGQILAGFKVQRGIFRGDTLSALLFVIAMIPLDYILRTFIGG